MDQVAAPQPERVKLVYARPESRTCRAPRGHSHDWDIRRSVKKGRLDWPDCNSQRFFIGKFRAQRSGHCGWRQLRRCSIGLLGTGLGLGLRCTDFFRSSAYRLIFVLTTAMPPSASKQKRLAEKAAKQAAKANSADFSVSSSTPPGSTNGGSSLNTPLTSLSAATSQEDLTSMAKLQIATERLILFNSLS
jgi:hypothetical protein